MIVHMKIEAKLCDFSDRLGKTFTKKCALSCVVALCSEQGGF
jgi:hypothetical protein